MQHVTKRSYNETPLATERHLEWLDLIWVRLPINDYSHWALHSNEVSTALIADKEGFELENEIQILDNDH